MGVIIERIIGWSKRGNKMDVKRRIEG